MKIFCDALETFVEIPEHVERIVSLAPSITETLAMLGLEKRIVGIDTYSRNIVDAPVICDSFLEIDRCIDRIREIEPDLVLGVGGAQLASAKKLVHRVPIYIVPLPRSVYGVLELVEIVAHLCGADPSKLLNDMMNTLTRLGNSLPQLRTVAILAFSPNEIVVAGRGTHVYSALRHLGLVIAISALSYQRIDKVPRDLDLAIIDVEPNLDPHTIAKIIDLDMDRIPTLILRNEIKMHGPRFVLQTLPKIVENIKKLVEAHR